MRTFQLPPCPCNSTGFPKLLLKGHQGSYFFIFGKICLNLLISVLVCHINRHQITSFGSHGAPQSFPGSMACPGHIRGIKYIVAGLPRAFDEVIPVSGLSLAHTVAANLFQMLKSRGTTSEKRERLGGWNGKGHRGMSRLVHLIDLIVFLSIINESLVWYSYSKKSGKFKYFFF